MNVASLENCKELYKLSGWKDTELVYAIHGTNPTFANNVLPDIDFNNSPPAYDLGYLLRKLPSFYFVYCGKSGETWYPAEMQGGPTMKMPPYIFDNLTADTPEDAAAKLAIELHRQGVLPGERNASQQASPREH